MLQAVFACGHIIAQLFLEFQPAFSCSTRLDFFRQNFVQCGKTGRKFTAVCRRFFAESYVRKGRWLNRWEGSVYEWQKKKPSEWMTSIFGDPYGNRTHITAVKGRCLNLLTNGPGSGNLTRTDDTPGMNRMLYQLSYAAINVPYLTGTMYYKGYSEICQLHLCAFS